MKSTTSNEFQENKINLERAENIFGPDYKDIINKAAKHIYEKFDNLTLAHASKKGKTPANSFTMGWN
ncbi:hypothetical protein JCM19045_361 [Bacillus sp. JCM 19045]|nr:hypothetical protein JCM19045_361 [Bacillus sp. JCM 19045]